MFLIGLTGSIGMGKTQTAALFEAEGVPRYDADAAVHALYENGGAAVAPIGALVPEALVDGAVDRGRRDRFLLREGFGEFCPGCHGNPLQQTGVCVPPQLIINCAPCFNS